MFVSTKPRKRNAPRIAEKDAPAFKQYVRGRECIFTGMGKCDGKVEAMHLDFAGGKGVGTKVADKYCVPACHGHHARQHNMGWDTFLRSVGLSKEDVLGAAGWLWGKWPGRPAYERKLDGEQ